jgi:hypothetical protein
VRKSSHLYAVVFCVAFAVMALELLQTRVLSALFWNHVVYLTVTVALMGFGVSGVFVSLVSRRLENPERWAAVCLGGFAISSFVSLRVASFVPEAYPIGQTIGGAFVQLVLCYAVLTVPFLFAGVTLGLIFMTHGRNIHRLYFADLAASAAGAVAFTLLLRSCGGDQFGWLIAGVALAGFLLYARLAALPLPTTLWMTGLFVMGFLCSSQHLLGTQPESYKTSYMAHNPFLPWKVECSVWTPTTKLDVLSYVSEDYHDEQGEKHVGTMRLITQDGTAHTPMFGEEFIADLLRQGRPGHPVLGANLVYQAFPRPEEALVIGVGGGVDMVSARAMGARHVTGVEINQATIDLVQGPYRQVVQWPEWDGISLLCAEGRHFVKSTDRRYDTIVMNGIDTFSALSSGAYVLSENYLYTVEAFEDYLRCLKPGGAMSISRWLFRQPRESLRLTNLYLNAAERAGVAEPGRSILHVAYPGPGPRDAFRWCTTVFKKEPFTPEQVRAVLDVVRAQPDLAMVTIPDVFPKEEQAALEAEFYAHDAEYLKPARTAFHRLVRSRSAAERAAFEEEYCYNIAPVYDDRPFFFEYHKIFESATRDDANRFDLRGTMVHYTLFFLLAVTTVVAFLAMIVPLYWFEREGLRVRGLWGLLGFFSSLGVGFMFVELGLTQRLNIYLGHPMYSLSVVLAGLLLSTGVGSYLSDRTGLTAGRALGFGMLGTALAVLVWLVAMNRLIPATLAQPQAVRLAITLASIVPVGLLMGIPFATGVRSLHGSHARFIPWVWGINGLTSVMASVLAIILAMRAGFQWVVLLGSATYFLGWLAVRGHLRRQGEETELRSPATNVPQPTVLAEPIPEPAVSMGNPS